MTWNLEEFRTLCNIHSLTDTKIYQEALVLKSWRANNFGAKALEVWEHLHSISDEIVVGGEEWTKVKFESESYIEAALQASHSLADIIAQIVNIAVLGGHFIEAEVSFMRVHQQLINQGVAENVVNSFQQFLNSQEYQYINGFVNTIKHRNLIYTDFQIEFGVGTRNEQGMRFKSFTYNNVQFTIKWASDIVEKMIPQVDNGIIDIGNAINDYLR